MKTGVITYFNESKGYGFIEDGKKQSIYVHFSAIETRGYRTLKEGEKVEFEVREGSRGLEAVRVRPL